jgi:hypothetical protein
MASKVSRRNILKTAAAAGGLAFAPQGGILPLQQAFDTSSRLGSVNAAT